MIVAGLVLILATPVRAAEDAPTQLMSAAAAGDLEKVQELLAAGSSVEESDATGRTAMWYAVDARKTDVLAVLLKNAAVLQVENPFGRGTVERALELNEWPLLRPFLLGAHDDSGWSETARAALTKSVLTYGSDRAKSMIADPWLPVTIDGNNGPLLAQAIVAGDVASTAFLLDCGLDPNTRIGSPVDPKFTESVSQKLVRYYLKNDRGVSVLMLAAGLENLEMVKLLLARGAREGACTYRFKMAAMSFAADLNNHDVMRALIGPCPQPSELRVEISIASQRATLIKNEKPIESTTISTGVQGKETKKGTYIVTNKEPLHISTIYKGAKMPFFMRLNCGDFGMHQGVVTGSPASHGCVRLPAAIARRWYSRVPVGTEVSIY